MGGQAPIEDDRGPVAMQDPERLKRQKAAAASIAELAGRDRMASSATLPERIMDARYGAPMRADVSEKIMGGGEPVLDERGRTVGVVYKNRFGMGEYSGQSEYNPIAAEIQRKSGTGDIPFKNVVKTDTGYKTIVQPLKPIEGTNIMQRATIPTTTTSFESETSSVVTPEITPEVVPDDTSSLQLASAAQRRGRGAAARRATRGTRLSGAGKVEEGYGVLLRGTSPRSTV